MMKIKHDSLTLGNKVLTNKDIFRGICYDTENLEDTNIETIENIKTGEIINIDKYELEAFFTGC